MHNTIKKRSEFQKVYKEGARLNAHTVRICFLSTQNTPRLAFVAPKKVGNAVVRNRCKRVLRAAFKQTEWKNVNKDIILFATKKTKHATSQDVAEELQKLLKKIM